MTTKGSRLRWATLLLVLGWIFYLLVLLTDDFSRQIPPWAGPPHFTSIAILALVIASAIAIWRNANPTGLGWLTLVIGSGLVISLECAQLINPLRTFQIADIIEGVAGAATGAMLSVLLFRALGRKLFSHIITAGATGALLFCIFLFWENEPRIKELRCHQQSLPDLNWQASTISNFKKHENKISANVNDYFTRFCIFDGLVTIENSSLVMKGGGLLSVPLTGLATAIRKTGTLSFGIRFNAHQQKADGPPHLIAGLTREGKSISYLARFSHNGPHLGASLQFNRREYSGTSMANRIENRSHEVVIVYDGVQQTTWLDGVVVGTEKAQLKPPIDDGNELVLHLGKRTDGRRMPYDGNIEAIYIGTIPLKNEHINSIFTH